MANGAPGRQAGLTLIELMISITLGLLVLVAVLLLFQNSNSTRNEIEKAGRQIENGSYAMQVLSQDLQLAGYLGELPTAPAAPAALPDPCATDLATLKGALGLHVQGYDNSNGGLSCLADVKAGTDVLVVRRASTCSSANPQDTNCDAPSAGHAYLQVSGCANDVAPPGQTLPPYYLLDTDTAHLTFLKIGCAQPARMLRYRTHIYFIASNNTAGDGIPTLKRWELGAGIVALVEGIDSLHFEYGVDSSGDGIPDSYSAAPVGVGNWANVTAVRINLLARNSDPSAGHSDSKTYSLGLNADGSANSLGPFNDAYKRHAYAATVRLANPAGRRE